MPNFIFNHLALSVKDVDESIAFYQKIFRFKEIKNTASESKTRWLSLSEGQQLHLIPRPDAIIKTNKAVHFAFKTSDLNLFIKHIKALNRAFRLHGKSVIYLKSK